MDERYYVTDNVLGESYIFDTQEEVREFLISVYEDANDENSEFDWEDFLIVKGVEIDPLDIVEN